MIYITKFYHNARYKKHNNINYVYQSPTPNPKRYSVTRLFRQNFCLNFVEPVVLKSYFLSVRKEIIQWSVRMMRSVSFCLISRNKVGSPGSHPTARSSQVKSRSNRQWIRQGCWPLGASGHSLAAGGALQLLSHSLSSHNAKEQGEDELAVSGAWKEIRLISCIWRFKL